MAAEAADRDLKFRFDGRDLRAPSGVTIAAALVAAGAMRQSTAKDGAPRGLFCGMGVCHDCLVTVDGRASQRACLTPLRDGMAVASQTSGPIAVDGVDLAVPPDTDPTPEIVDVAIIGAGPAGLAAALALGRAGLATVLLDERPSPGGQYFKQPRAGQAPRDAQGRRGAELIAQVRAAGVDLRSGTLVWGGARLPGGGLEIWTLRDGAAGLLYPRHLMIATGAYERPTIVPGWTLPGVMTTGAAQTLLRSANVTPGGRVLVAGNGPLNLQVAHEMVRAGRPPLAVVEAAAPPWTRPATALRLVAADPRLAAAGIAHLAALARAGIPVLWGHRLRRLDGDDRVARACVAPVDHDGDFRDGPDRWFDVDAVCTGDGFWPASELARLLGCQAAGEARLDVERDEAGATSQPDIFVVGEAGRFGGAGVAEAQGALAAARIFASRGGTVPSIEKPTRDLRRHHRFQKRLWDVFAASHPGLRHATPDTVLCRCEAVHLGPLQTMIRDGMRDVGTIKRLTRVGMGRCQGRYCGPALHTLLREAGEPAPTLWAPQAPLRPVPLAALARQKPEWGGHARTLLPPWRAIERPPLPVTQVETLVIGAGIVGVSTAFFLARAGHDVGVVDRGQPNGLASGGNAGSLHAQLLSFDHGAKAEAGGGPAARTLPLQRDSIALWQQLERELDADFEIKITGGVMVAETEVDLRFLEEKTALERRMGVECHVIDADELRRREPALDPRFRGAAYCPIEGKINPLVATQPLADAARAAGARFFADTHVRAIERERNGWRVETQRGTIRTHRIVNAAGAFAADVAALAGLNIPVFGAPLQMVVTEAAVPTLNGLVAHADRHLSLKQAANGNFIIGGGWTARLDPVHQHPRPPRASLEGNLWVAQHVVPSLRTLHILRSWAAMNINIDGAPILGEHPGAPGFFHAVTSNGYTLGPLVGRLTADMIVGGTTDRDLAPFSVARFG